jgi:hypothetical protein
MLSRAQACFNPLDFEELIATARGKRVLLMIHGMAKDWDAAAKDFFNIYQNIKGEMGDRYDVFVAISWPGDRTLGPGPYVRANKSSKKTGNQVADELEQLAAASASLDAITHSMGSRVLAKGLKRSGVQIDNLILLAPSILKRQFEPLHRWHSMPKHVREHLVVCHSKGDWAFNWTSMQHAGMGYEGAKYLSPRKHPRLTQLDCSAIINQDVYKRQPFQPFKSRSNHSFYCQNSMVFIAISNILAHAPPQEAIKLEMRETGQVVGLKMQPKQ